jgi:hypothetical protein
MSKAFLTPGMQEFIDQMDAWQREDAPWLYEAAPAELPRAPVRGRGGKPTGEYLPTGKESLKQLEIQMGRKITPAGANPLAAGTELPTRADRNESLRRVQQASASAVLGPLDQVAKAMERKWGVGRLQTLVPEEWALKFHSACDKLNEAIDSSDMGRIKERAEIMRRGWTKLDELATAAGHEPWVAPDVWEVQSENGTIYAIVRGDVDRRNGACRQGVAVYTLAEVAKILQAWDEDGQVSILKAEFPDATLVKAGVVRNRIDPADDPSAGI